MKLKSKSRKERKKNPFKVIDLRKLCFHAKWWGNRLGCLLVSPAEYNNPPACRQICPHWCCFNREAVAMLGIKAAKRPITLHDIMKELGLNPFAEGQSTLTIEINESMPLPEPKFKLGKPIKTQKTVLKGGHIITEQKEQATLF